MEGAAQSVRQPGEFLNFSFLFLLYLKYFGSIDHKDQRSSPSLTNKHL